MPLFVSGAILCYLLDSKRVGRNPADIGTSIVALNGLIAYDRSACSMTFPILRHL